MKLEDYSIRGEFHYTNFATLLEANVIPENELTIALGARWVGTFKLNDARTHIRPIIYFTGPWKSTLRVEFEMEIQNTRPSNETYSTRKAQLLHDEEHLEGPEIAISDVLNEENGWLSKGKLSVEYGIEVLAEKRVNDGWRFNFEGNATFDSYMELPVQNGMLYSHLFLIRYHSSMIDDWYLLGNDQQMLECWENLLKVRVQKKTIENCLQIVHGVNIRISMPNAIKIICSVHHLKFRNVLEYCQREIIQRHLDLRHSDVFDDPYTKVALWEHKYRKKKEHMFLLEFAMKLGLRHYLVHLLRDYDSLKSMIEHLKLVDLDSATGESMKMIVAMFFHGNY